MSFDRRERQGHRDASVDSIRARRCSADFSVPTIRRTKIRDFLGGFNQRQLFLDLSEQQRKTSRAETLSVGFDESRGMSLALVHSAFAFLFGRVVGTVRRYGSGRGQLFLSVDKGRGNGPSRTRTEVSLCGVCNAVVRLAVV